MKHFAFILGIILLASVQSLLALPRYALLTGARCASCHVNPTGGQMRNDYGITYSQNAVPLRSTDVASPKTVSDSTSDTAESTSGSDEFMFNPRINDYISIGGDYRGQFIYDLGSNPRTTAFQSMTATFYTSIQIGKKINLYYKQDFLNPGYGNPHIYDLGGPEIYSIVKVIPSTFIKGGAFLPDYGWKVDDHTQYTRGGDLGYTSAGVNGGLIFTPNYKDVGMEVGWWSGGLSITAGLYNGEGVSQQISFSYLKAYSVKAEYMGSASGVNYRFGSSGYRNKDFLMGGFHAGVGIGDCVVFGEIDWTRNRWNPFDGTLPEVIYGLHSMATFAELDYRAVQGVWGILRYEMFDPLSGTPNDPNYVRPSIFVNGKNSISRLVVGAEIFPYSFVEIRPQYRFDMETPSISNDVALVQFHYWF